MKAWKITPGNGWQSLELVDVDMPDPGPGQVRIKVEAASLNARDLMIAAGHYPGPMSEKVIPVSDGAGRITAVGEGVVRVAVGDHVVIPWNPAHADGKLEPWMMSQSLGALLPGLLVEETIQDANGLVPLPDNRLNRKLDSSLD